MGHNSYKEPLKFFIITGIVLITVIKLNLMGTGSLSFPDEFRYSSSQKALQCLSELKIRASVNAIFSTDGRPADAILKLIPNAMQYATAYIFKLHHYESYNSYPLFVFNFIIYCLILIVHFKFSYLLMKDSLSASISVLLYSVLTNSHLYLRHALPYDTSLLIFYLVIYNIVFYTEKDNLSFRKSLLLGTGSFFGYLVYPGYVPLFLTGLFLLFFNKLTKINILKKTYHSGYYVLGSIICLFFFEAVSRLGSGSYIWDAVRISGGVTQGSFEESFTFIIKYLFEVEGMTGIFLMISLAIFYFIMGHQIKNRAFQEHSTIILLGSALTGLFLIYASAGYFLHKMVFYGRLLHQYLPFVCLFSAFSINLMPVKALWKKELFLLFISLLFIVNFGVNFIDYKSFAYPRDVAWELRRTHNKEDIAGVCEYEDSFCDHEGWSVIPLEKGNAHSDIIVVNSCFIFPVHDLAKYHIFKPGDNYRLAGAEPYFLNFKAYQYEGYNIIERQNIDKMNLQIKTFSR